MEKYNNYKDSGIEWIGEIPEHWEVSRIKFYLDYQKGKNPKELKFSESNESEIYLSMDYLRGNPKQMLYVEDVENYVKVDKNDILLLWDGSNAGEFILSKKGILSSTMAVLNLKNIQKEYSWYFFKHFEPQLKKSTIGMGVPHVNGEELKNGLIALPTPEEQTAIANYLDRKTTEIDELIADKKRLLELYEEEKTAIINQAVTKGINPNVPMKDSGIEWLGEIPEHWEVLPIKYTLSTPITDGPHETPELVPDGIPFISAEAIKNDKIDFNKKRGFISREEHERFSLKYKPQIGDVYMIKSGATTGNLAIVETDIEFNIWSPLAAMRPNYDVLLSEFLFYFMKSKSFFAAIEIGWNYGTQQNIGMKVLENIRMVLPSTNEQKEIVEHIKIHMVQIDSQIDKINRLIDLLTEYRTALISEVVTGKIKVTE